jgi:hypothetical protein
MHFGFATYAGLDGLTPSDQLAADELERRGARVTPIPWTAEGNWHHFDAVVIRATWDYHTRPAEFRSWLETLQTERVPLWNPAPVALWNLNKAYLRDLEHAGVSVVPTAWVAHSADHHSLRRLIGERGWDDVVVKPAISATAYRTWRTRGEVSEEDELRFRDLVRVGDVMVQPLMQSIVAEGEYSFVFLGGEFSHAVLKRAAAGDFRVQTNFGGTVMRAEPRPVWVSQANAVLDAVTGPWLYARVDGCIVDDCFVLVELELLEPDLFLNLDPRAPSRFADVILSAGLV